MTGAMNNVRAEFTATLLPDGKVLVAGGAFTNSAELYNPPTRTWTLTDPMSITRGQHTATFLPNGKVLVAGGFDWTTYFILIPSAELYDPVRRTWMAGGAMNTARYDHTATLLPNGKVLFAGGRTGFPDDTILSSAELYDAGLGPNVFR